MTVFPHSERVVYARNPLAEVICQVRFPRILSIDTELPSTLQQRLRARYPEFTESALMELPVLPPELAGLERSLLGGGQRKFDFASTGGEWRISLTSQFLALTATKYERWEDFRERIDQALVAVSETYSPAPFSRVGLRYQNLIRRSRLGLSEVPWSDLLRAHLLGELGDPWLSGRIVHAASDLVIRLDEPGQHLRIHHGFVEAADDQEQSYLIDADFFRETPTEVTDALGVLEGLNKESGRLFRWCIESRLHTAMEPKQVR